MTAVRLNVLGAGRAAQTVARWLAEAGLVEIAQVANRSTESAAEAVAFMGGGQIVERIEGLGAADWLLMGLPDGSLSREAARWSGGRPALAFHLSGSSPADVLMGVAPLLASVHPARAFSDPVRALQEMPGTWLVGEGDPLALSRLGAMVKAAGGCWQTVNREGKIRYHAATVIASNYLVTLTDLARRLAHSSGLSDTAARHLLDGLQRGTLDNLVARSSAEALTGPVERADLHQLERLQAAMHNALPESIELLDALGLQTLRLARQGRGAREADQQIDRLFTNP